MNKRAFTLIEIVISFAIIAIAFYSLINVFAMVAGKSTDSSTAIATSYLLQSKMEEAVARYKNTNPQEDPIIAWTCFDNTGNLLDYPGEFSQYWYQIKLEYIDKNSDPIEVKELAQADINDMKKLTVEVKKQDQGGQLIFNKAVWTILPSRIQ